MPGPGGHGLHGLAAAVLRGYSEVVHKERLAAAEERGGRVFKLRRLDRPVIDRPTRATDRGDAVHFQTVRCPFEEGDPVCEGGMIKTQSHIQVAVRDRACIASRIYPVSRREG
jgi:hypothetical protein